jgi:hypothetical protein
LTPCHLPQPFDDSLQAMMLLSGKYVNFNLSVTRSPIHDLVDANGTGLQIFGENNSRRGTRIVLNGSG